MNRYQHVEATSDNGGESRDLELVADNSPHTAPYLQQQQRSNAAAGLSSFAPPLLSDTGSGASGSVGLSAPMRLAQSKYARCGCELLAICVALVVAFLVGASTRPGENAASCAPAVSKPGPTIVLSFDGFRPSYLSAAGSPNLWSLKSDRHVVYAERMEPRFPSLTFPNHYALVTGLYPESHGITANHIFDPTTGQEFTYTNVSSQTSPWFHGQPIWGLAEQFGIKTGTIFWVGSETLINGQRPNVWLPYNAQMSNQARVDQLFAWIDSGACELCLVYFSDVDTAGHMYGPDSPQVAAAVTALDALVGEIQSSLASRGLDQSSNLVVLSDHGMAAVRTTLYIEDFLNASTLAQVSAQENGAFTDIWPHTLPPPAGLVDSILAQIAAKANPNVQCWAKESVPATFHYAISPRIAPVVCLAALGFVMSSTDVHSSFYFWRGELGCHGYDPTLPDMGAIFFSRAAQRWDSGVDGQAGAVSNLANSNVFSVLSYLVGITPSPNNGTLVDFGPFMNSNSSGRGT